MEVDDTLLSVIYRSMSQDADFDPDFDFIVAMNIAAEIAETTPAHLSPRKRIRIWSQHVHEQQ